VCIVMQRLPFLFFDSCLTWHEKKRYLTNHTLRGWIGKVLFVKSMNTELSKETRDFSGKGKNQAIVILGAGLAGLSCTLQLAKKGYSNITILERESDVGGLANSLQYKNHTSDFGPHRIHTEIKRVEDFLHEFAGDLLVRRKRISHMWLDKRFIPYPPGFISSLGHFGLYQMMRFTASYVGCRLGSLKSRKEAASYETVMQKAFGKALYEAIIKPYTEKTWGIRGEEISPDVAHARVSAGGFAALAKRLFVREKKGKETSLKEFGYVPGGIKNLAVRLRELLLKKDVRIMLDSEVKGFSKAKQGSLDIHFNKQGTEQTLEADFCFSTIPLPELIDYLHRINPSGIAKKAASELEYLSMILVFVRVGKPGISKDTWLYFPERDIIFNRGYEAKNYDPNMGPERETLICLEITCRKQDQIWSAGDEEIKQRVFRDLLKTGLVKKEEIMDGATVFLSHAYPVYKKGYYENLKVLWGYLEQIPWLISLGRQGQFHHNNMDHSLYEGIIAADYFATRENASRQWYRDETQFRRLRIVD